MNREAIQRTLDLIRRTEPEQVQMRHYFTNGRVKLGPDDVAGIKTEGDVMNCKTAACIAGFAVIANLETIRKTYDCADGWPFVDILAGKVLELDNFTRMNVFNMHGVEMMHSAHTKLLELSREHGTGKVKVGLESSPVFMFDNLPDVVRKQACVNLLEHWLESSYESIDWLAATEKAIESYKRGELSPA